MEKLLINDNKAIVKRMFEEVFAGESCDEALVRRHFSTEYVQCVDGKVLGFEEFLRHLRILKDATRTISFEFKALIQEGDIVFSNHVVTVKPSRGDPWQPMSSLSFDCATAR